MVDIAKPPSWNHKVEDRPDAVRSLIDTDFYKPY